MRREIRTSSRFKTDLKKLSSRDKLVARAVVDKLQIDEPLEPKYRDHDLHGNYDGYRECTFGFAKGGRDFASQNSRYLLKNPLKLMTEVQIWSKIDWKGYRQYQKRL